MAKMIDLEKTLSIAQSAIRRAGDYLRDQFELDHAIWEKHPHDINIAEDLESDKLILAVLAKYFPEHKIISEESGISGQKNSEYVWLIDPLDGTTNFSLNVPLFCTQLALAQGQKVILSIIYLPTSDMMMWAIKGKGTLIDGKKVGVSRNDNLRRSIIALERGKEKKDFEWLGRSLPKIARNCRTYRNFNCTGIDTYLLAKGAIDGIVTCGAALHDVTPAVSAVIEAGGRITDERGKPWKFGSKFFVATNGKIHEKLLKVINEK